MQTLCCSRNSPSITQSGPAHTRPQAPPGAMITAGVSFKCSPPAPCGLSAGAGGGGGGRSPRSRLTSTTAGGGRASKKGGLLAPTRACFRSTCALRTVEQVSFEAAVHVCVDSDSPSLNFTEWCAVSVRVPLQISPKDAFNTSGPFQEIQSIPLASELHQGCALKASTFTIECTAGPNGPPKRQPRSTQTQRRFCRRAWHQHPSSSHKSTQTMPRASRATSTDLRHGPWC